MLSFVCMDKLKNDIEKIRNYITDLFKDENTGHDITHLENVLQYATQIQATEGGNLYVISISALLHDIHRLMSNNSNYITPQMSLPQVKEIMDMFNIDFKNEILYCIEHHEKKGGKEKFTLETLILQDADVLDALGERGLARTLKYCKTRDIPLVNFDYPLDTNEYVANTNPISTCHYVFRNLIPECENLNTPTAQKIAGEYAEIFRNFIKKHYTEEDIK